MLEPLDVSIDVGPTPLGGRKQRTLLAMLPLAPKSMASGRRFAARWVEVALAIAVFATMCFVVLSVAPQPAEPDDGAYQASLVAMSEGHFLTLSVSQAERLAQKMNDFPALVPTQWVALPDGRYISEKNPGYPFLAMPFYWLGLIRLVPLFYGALACLGLFAGARRWLGGFGGLAAVGLYCSSGAALAFAWRDFMPTFTDASLVAAGAGALLWVFLATEASSRRRGWVGLAGFVALELATFVRYTDVVILCCATVTVLAAWGMGALKLQLRALCAWLASVVVFGCGLGLFDDLVYGSPLRSGYPRGQITFDLGAIGPNLRIMPSDLMHTMPMLVLGLVSLIWIGARGAGLRSVEDERRAMARRDLFVGVALGGSWFAMWALYVAYTGTIEPGNVAVQEVRLYLPAIGVVALLAAWLITRIRGSAWRAVVASAAVSGMFAVGVSSFYAMYSALNIYLG